MKNYLSIARKVKAVQIHSGIFSRNKSDSDIDLLQFYEENEEFKNRIDEMVNDYLEYIWKYAVRDGQFQDTMVSQFLNAIVSDNCSYLKNIMVSFHNEVERLLLESTNTINAIININGKRFELKPILKVNNNTDC